MQFDKVYTPEQEKAREELRKEIQAFIKANGDGVNGGPVDDRYFAREQDRRNVEFRKEVGKKGWMYPDKPKEYGGAGLSAELVEVVYDEFRKLNHWESYGFPMGGVNFPSFVPNDHSSGMIGILEKIGTPEQKERLLPPLIRGEWVTWEMFTEPESGSDLPSLRTRAVRDGDEYVINGHKMWIGGNNAPPDMLMTLAVTDPDAPRHRNLSVFLIPCDLPGIRILPIDTLAPPYKNQVLFEDVRFPASCHVGEGGDGWVAFATRGGDGAGGSVPTRREHNEMIDYAKATVRNGQRISADPDVQDVLTKAYVDNEIFRLLNLRNRWMGEQSRAGTAKTRSTYQGGQMTVYRKQLSPRNADAMLKAWGPVSLISNDPWAPMEGAAELYHRWAIQQTHPGGTIEINKLRMFRAMIGPGTRIPAS